MKLLTNLVLFFVLFGIQSCGKDDCGECFTPPAPFYFQLVDHQTGEDIFINETYIFQDISLINLANNESVAFSQFVQDDVLVVQNQTIGWQTEMINYELRLKGDPVFNLVVDAERLQEDCCTFTRFKTINIEGANFELDAATNIYTISVE